MDACVCARPGVFVRFSHVMNATAPAAIPGRRPSSAGAAGAHIAHCTLHARTAPIPLPSAESSASPGCDARGHARRPRPGTRSAGPVWTDCGVPTRQRPRPPRPRMDRRHRPCRPDRRTGHAPQPPNQRSPSSRASGHEWFCGGVGVAPCALSAAARFECLYGPRHPVHTKRCAELDGVARISEAMHLPIPSKALQRYRLNDGFGALRSVPSVTHRVITPILCGSSR